jgi:hypothetical protein
MMALAYLVAAGLYLGLMFVVVRGAWRSGCANGGSKTKAFGLATTGFLLVYLPVFWNWIPEMLLHRYHCRKDSGFVAHVDAQKWRFQNSTSLELIDGRPIETPEKLSPRVRLTDGTERYTYFHGMLASESHSETLNPRLLNLRRSVWRLVDEKTKQVLATATDYSTGESSTQLRFWLYRSSCVEVKPTEVGKAPEQLTPLNQLFFYDNILQGVNK